MPSKNTVKIYSPNAYYHVYNRGVEKRIIFNDEQDYKVFLNYLKEALLSPPDPKTKKISFTLQGSTFKGVPRQNKNFYGRIELIAFVLMPNHFHFLVKQSGERDLREFMQSLATRYSMYFNKKHDRVGGLFQGIYKAALVDSEAYLLHLSRYIHRNPVEIGQNIEKAYSSYSTYLEKQRNHWVKPEIVLSYFFQKNLSFQKKITTYKSFVEDYNQDDREKLGSLTLDT